VAVQWSERCDRVLAGDLTAALAYVTPAGGAVVTAVAPIGLRDRERGELTFTTSLGFGRKLDRIRRDPKIALLYHAREHGFHEGDELVLVQGTARIVEDPDQDYLDRVVQPAAAQYLGAPRTGAFWDRWLREYYSDRVPVHVDVERIAVWPTLDAAGQPDIEGAPWPAAPPPQAPPRNGAGPRVDAERAGRRAREVRHALFGYRGADGFPVIVPVDLGQASARGIAVTSATALPPGGRRAGLLAHDYGPQLVALRVRQFTGWFEDGVYAPHTEQGFRAPANKTLLLLANGFMAKRGLRKARKAAAVAA
jgi:Pyridoxamine 5'-phosphate oxidase